MIAFIRGKLIQSSPSRIIVETNGVGYEILIALSTASELPQTGSEVLIHTNLIVREDSQTLYGFLNLEDKDLFNLLLNVNGIGPKTALNVIGFFSFENLAEAIHAKDIVTLAKVPGIGKKSAERLIVELKDKLPSFGGAKSFQIAVPKMDDALSALINLGFTPSASQKALKKTTDLHGEDIELTELITLSLKHI